MKPDWSMILPVTLALMGWTWALIRLALTDRNNIAERVKTLEVQRFGDSQRMERIEDKLDRLLERVK